MTLREERLIQVIETMIKLEPDVAPGPTAINEMMGRRGKLNNLSGKDAALRAQILKKHGFVKDGWSGRWYKP